MRERERRLQALPALRQVSVNLPEAAHADCEAQCRPGVSRLEGVAKSGPKIVVLALDACKPARLIAAGQARFGLIRKCDEVFEMPAARVFLLAGCAQSLER